MTCRKLQDLGSKSCSPFFDEPAVEVTSEAQPGPLIARSAPKARTHPSQARQSSLMTRTRMCNGLAWPVHACWQYYHGLWPMFGRQKPSPLWQFPKSEVTWHVPCVRLAGQPASRPAGDGRGCLKPGRKAAESILPGCRGAEQLRMRRPFGGISETP